MMKRWAVGYINFYDNDLVIEIVEAADWRAALCAHSKLADMAEIVLNCADLEAAKVEAFDQDSMIDVVEIPEVAGEVWHP